MDPKMIYTDDGDEEEEFKLWQKRENVRLARQNQNNKYINENARNQVYDDNSNEIKPFKSYHVAKKIRPKMKFLQKYYHKGAFFQTDTDDKFGTSSTEPIYSRNFWESTPSESFDKTLLPVVMQVKNFGRRGRTKWTHLVAEDTSIQGQSTLSPIISGKKIQSIF
jgi:microfibrillar-associated protein 1